MPSFTLRLKRSQRGLKINLQIPSFGKPAKPGKMFSPRSINPHRISISAPSDFRHLDTGYDEATILGAYLPYSPAYTQTATESEMPELVSDIDSASSTSPSTPHLPAHVPRAHIPVLELDHVDPTESERNSIHEQVHHYHQQQQEQQQLQSIDSILELFSPAATTPTMTLTALAMSSHLHPHSAYSGLTLHDIELAEILSRGDAPLPAALRRKGRNSQLNWKSHAAQLQDLELTYMNLREAQGRLEFEGAMDNW